MSDKYEDRQNEIDELLRKHRGKWQLDALAWLSFEDVSQIIRIHIHKKWELWDQQRPFRPWANRLISNQIKNLIRNNYSNFAKPCLHCEHNLGDEKCGLTESGEQNDQCPIYAKWGKAKKNAHDVKLPLPLSFESESSATSQSDQIDYDRSSANLHKHILGQLNEKQQKVYRLLFIEGLSDEDVAERVGFKAETSRRKNKRFKQINNLKKQFYLLAKKLLDEEDIIV